MASASLGTDHFAWGDVLFERVKASLAAFDDVVNLQTIQISLLMISHYLLTLLYADWHRFYANYQNEQGRPNSTFLHLGSASRKALSAGLHKDVPHDVDQTPENIEERRVTFWSLYIYETYITTLIPIFDKLTNIIYIAGSAFMWDVLTPSHLKMPQ